MAAEAASPPGAASHDEPGPTGVATSAAAEVLSLRAPAKVNLHVHVLGRRADGLHLLDSLVVFPDVADQVSVAPAPGGVFTLAVSGPFAAGAPTDGTNLALRAARALDAAAGGGHGAALTLDKALPAAGGIGGGSSDAAATLRLLNRLWRLDLPPERLAAIGLTLGADLPVCLAAPAPTLMGGIGEVLRPAGGVPPLWLCLANPGVPVPTADVFRALRDRDGAAAAWPAGGVATLDDLVGWLGATRNMLEPPAREVAPAIADLLAALAAQPGCRLARMSGSGGTCFGLFGDEAPARAAADALGRTGIWAAAGRTAGS